MLEAQLSFPRPHMFVALLVAPGVAVTTTSTSILQPQRPKFVQPFGKIYQAINADTLRAQNMETWPYFNQIPIKAPGSGKDELEITYLDEEFRISRGDKGNLFILKMVDPTYRVPLSTE